MATTTSSFPSISSAPYTSADLEKALVNAQKPSHADQEYAEGGFVAWTTVAGSWFLLFCTLGITNAFGVFESYYTLEKYTDRSTSDIAWIGSLQTFLMFVLGGVAGPLFDKGYFYFLTVAGSVLYVVCFFMISLCNEFWQTFLAQGVGCGIAIGLLFLPAITIVSQYFKKRRGIASGIVVTGSSAGGIVFPIMLNKLITKCGFAKGVQYTGCLIVACLIFAHILIRPFGGIRAGHGTGEKPDPRSFLKEPSYVLAILGVFLVAWGLFYPIFFIQYFAELTGASSNLVFYTLAILNGASVIGRTFPNLIADWFGPFNLLAIMCASCSVMAWAFFGASHSTAALIVVDVLYGITSGAFFSLLSPAFFSTAKTQGEVGMRLGLPIMILSVAALTGNPIAGALLDKYGFGAAIVWCGVCISAGTVLIACSNVFTAREKGTWKV